MNTHTFEEKAAALSKLVEEAVHPTGKTWSRSGRGPQMDRLIDALTTTDAIDVLNEILAQRVRNDSKDSE